MYLNESSFTEQMEAREQQLARELELRRVIRERMLEEGLLDDRALGTTHLLHFRWRGAHRPGHA